MVFSETLFKGPFSQAIFVAQLDAIFHAEVATTASISARF